MCEEQPTRKYEGNADKHKYPKGYGSKCPRDMPAADAQRVLDRAVSVDTEKELWAVDGEWCFCARPTRIEQQIWHGYPVVGGHVPDNVLQALRDRGRITRQQLRRLRKQKVLPGSWL